MVIDLHKSYDSINILLERNNKPFNDEERFQNLEESIKLDEHIKNTLLTNTVPFRKMKVNGNTVNKILDIIWEQR